MTSYLFTHLTVWLQKPNREVSCLIQGEGDATKNFNILQLSSKRLLVLLL